MALFVDLTVLFLLGHDALRQRSTQLDRPRSRLRGEQRGQQRLNITLANVPGNAVRDVNRSTRLCSAIEAQCDTGALVQGRGAVGPETTNPNTCFDGSSGSYHASQSLDRLRVFTTDGTPFDSGKTVTIEATVWSSSSTDRLDLYYNTSGANFGWTFLVTLSAAQRRRVRAARSTIATTWPSACAEPPERRCESAEVHASK